MMAHRCAGSLARRRRCSWPALRRSPPSAHHTQQRVCKRYVALAAPIISSLAVDTEQLLDQYWEARGVFDPAQRKRLVEAAQQSQGLGAVEALGRGEPLPGLPSTWTLDQSASEVLEVSRRLVALQQLLGGGPAEVDVVWMVVRQPGLLTADFNELTGRLIEMKLATFGMGVDVLKVVAAQPALLLNDAWRVDLTALQAERQDAPPPPPAGAASASAGGDPTTHANGNGNGSAGSRYDDDFYWAQHLMSGDLSPALAGSTTSSSSSRSSRLDSDSLSGSSSGSAAAGAAEPAASSTSGREDSSQERALQQLVQAWEYGLSSDGDAEWRSRFAQLFTYQERYGDTCAGFRDGDDAELARWASKQRSDRRRGELSEARLAELQRIGFIFDADEAEWCRWFAELVQFKAEHGHCSPMPLVTGGDLYLIHWAAIQRIARRSRMLSDSRVTRLDELGFDWTGADPLS